MKKIILALTAFAFLLICNNLNAQSTTPWPEKDNFHKVMSQTFHPMQTGDFKPIRKRSAEMYEMALAWQESSIPVELANNSELQKKLKNLTKAAKQLDSKIKSGCTNQFIIEKLTGLHDIFHDIVGICSSEEHH